MINEGESLFRVIEMTVGPDNSVVLTFADQLSCQNCGHTGQQWNLQEGAVRKTSEKRPGDPGE